MGYADSQPSARWYVLEAPLSITGAGIFPEAPLEGWWHLPPHPAMQAISRAALSLSLPAVTRAGVLLSLARSLTSCPARACPLQGGGSVCVEVGTQWGLLLAPALYSLLLFLGSFQGLL